jgi:hypothetical protein
MIPLVNDDRPTAASERRIAAKAQRAADAKRLADERKARKLHVIAERRAKQHRMSKADFIAQIVGGKYPPITAEDLAAEPDPPQALTLPAALQDPSSAT